MDPFDEFEFKPLTDGLGFHKKQKTLKQSVEASGLMDRVKPSLPADLSSEDFGAETPKVMSFEDIVKSLDKVPLKGSSLEFSESLPREKKVTAQVPDFQMMDVEMDIPTQSPFPTPENYRRNYTQEIKKVPAKDQLQSVGVRRGAADSPRSNLMVSPGSLSASILDLVVVMALGLIFTSVLLAVTKVELQTLVNSANTDFMTQISVGVLLVAVMQIYFIIARSFFGRTLGEWTFDLQLGRDDEHKSENYPMRVMMRSLLVTMTGVFLIPVISFLLRMDIAGQITGLKLYRQRI